MTIFRFDFFESHHLVLIFAKNHQVKIPENLKYLVHQDRISKDIRDFGTHLSIYESKEQLGVLKTPRFVPSRASLREEVPRSPKGESKEESMCNLMSTLRITMGPDMRFLTCRSINHNKSVDSSMREDDISFTQFETKIKFGDSVADKDHSISSHHSHSRCKSQSENVKCAQDKRPKRETETTKSIEQIKIKPAKRFSGFSTHIKTAGSNIEKFKKSDKSLTEL
jgi:hypothetical protein